MESDKIEEHFKKVLAQKEIKPSDNAWERIASELGEPQKTPKRLIWLWQVAAILVGLLMITGYFMTRENGAVSESINPVVHSEEKSDELLNKGRSEEKLLQEIPIEEAVIVSKEEKDGVKITPIIDTKPTDLNTLVVENNSEFQDPNIETRFENVDAVIAEKVEGVLARVQDLEATKGDVTDAEVDSLLRKAQQEILVKKWLNQDNHVDAMVLLSEVETELDQSFRDRVFEKLKSGFIKVRTAVADRNN